MKVFNLFPTPIGYTTLSKGMSKKELDFIVGQPRRNNMSNTSSVDSYLLDSPELAELKQSLLNATKEYFATVYCPNPHEVDIYITQSWANYTEPGQSHHQHTHPNSFISGVLYIQTASEVDKINFYKERTAPTQIIPTESNIWNSWSWWLAANKGTLLLFPSELKHAVEHTNDNSTRISLAFNTYIRGELGSSSDLTKLKL